MAHAVFTITVSPLEPGRELIIAELAEIGFDGFLETDTGVESYIEEKQIDQETIDEVFSRLRRADFTITTSRSILEEKNWNEEWEKNFDPVEVGKLCRIRAPFHEFKDGFKEEVIIMPKMSFGTGHHATTSLMVEYLMTTPVQSPLLDMGSGTAILAILARKLDVKDVTAIDIDDWAFENAADNCKLNSITGIEILKGDASLLGKKNFSTVLANINRNVLLSDIPKYTEVLGHDGQLFVSGFYTEDLELIKEVASESGLMFIGNKVKDNWVSAHFKKQ